LPNLKSDVLFSIIIPVYNSDKYLVQCIQSVLNQKLNNLEIILIEDCSTDNSTKICNSFAKKYNNIKLLINNQRQGVSSSRNYGIKKAIGEYIIFLDSDDYLLTNSLYNLKKLIDEKRRADLILVNFYVVNNGINFINSRKIFNKNIIHCKNTDEIISVINLNYAFNECWCYIFKRDFIIKNKLYFIPKINFAEDQEFVAKALCLCKRFSFFNKSYYCYRLSGNLSHQMGLEVSIACLKVVNSMCKFLKNKKLSKIKSKFFYKRIYTPLNELKPRLVCLNKKEILQLSNFINKNINNFRMLENTYQKNDIYFFIKKYGAKKAIKFFKLFIVDEIKSLVKDIKIKELYIFSANIYAKAVAKVMVNSGFLVKGFLDNNKLITGNRIQGLKIYLPSILLKKKISNYFIIICNQEKNTIHKISQQLKKIGFKNSQITYKNYHKERNASF